MTVERIAIESREQWLSLRKFDVTASVVGALSGLHPYVSALRLYYEKQGLIDFDERPDSGPLRRGRILESAVAAATAEQKPQWQIEKANEYYRDDELNLAATPDFYIDNDPRGLGILQAKTVAPSVYQREWQNNQPPMYITLQCLTECMLTNATFGAVAVLVVDPYELPCHIIEIPRHPGAEQKIRDEVRRFWNDIETGHEPGPDYAKDYELLKLLSPREEPGKSIDLSGDNEIMVALAERAELKERIKLADERCTSIETMLMAKMQDAERAIVPDWNISWKVEERKGYTVPPKSPRVLRIREKRTTV